MAARLKDETGLEAELIPGGGGIFDVVADGELVYSKFKTGSFPDEGQVVALLATRRK